MGPLLSTENLPGDRYFCMRTEINAGGGEVLSSPRRAGLAPRGEPRVTRAKRDTDDQAVESAIKVGL